MIFKDRYQAGKLLAKKIQSTADTLLLALPRGGVVVAKAISETLRLPLDVLVVKKISLFTEPELALGAVTASGKLYLDMKLINTLGVNKAVLINLISQAAAMAGEKEHLYRPDRSPTNISKKDVIIIDDGVATGSTVMAAIQQVKGVAKTVCLATPVIAPPALSEIKPLADKVYFLDSPLNFQAVGNHYINFEQLNDDDVKKILSKSIP